MAANYLKEETAFSSPRLESPAGGTLSKTQTALLYASRCPGVVDKNRCHREKSVNRMIAAAEEKYGKHTILAQQLRENPQSAEQLSMRDCAQLGLPFYSNIIDLVKVCENLTCPICRHTARCQKPYHPIDVPFHIDAPEGERVGMKKTGAVTSQLEEDDVMLSSEEAEEQRLDLAHTSRRSAIIDYEQYTSRANAVLVELRDENRPNDETLEEVD